MADKAWIACGKSFIEGHDIDGKVWFSYKEAAILLGITLEELAKMNQENLFRHCETHSTMYNKTVYRVWLLAEDVVHLKLQAEAEEANKMHVTAYKGVQVGQI